MLIPCSSLSASLEPELGGAFTSELSPELVKIVCAGVPEIMNNTLLTDAFRSDCGPEPSPVSVLASAVPVFSTSNLVVGRRSPAA
jgi:hypothetical protein